MDGPFCFVSVASGHADAAVDQEVPHQHRNRVTVCPCPGAREIVHGFFCLVSVASVGVEFVDAISPAADQEGHQHRDSV